MAQVVVYADRTFLDGRREGISDAVHGAVMAALDYPAEKRFHRFVPLAPEDFVHPADRGPEYTIVEISMFEGRSDEAKRALIRGLFERLDTQVGIAPHSVEICITETPKVNWGIRGANAADLELGYRVDV
ncbi:tautomerase family protein [Curtobacterium pusillum]|uniref:Tautomerase family protein n=1 Tax=Curtobacterium pusillum TaxID=69373 RepID=A0ABX2M6G5_9MICO|nr:tautomerase family protein [Curtobacterium pusillum]NUU13456.1 tautomerase family protein [Curtobacterium pusillum]GLK29826.1 tautomerase [Curtobacterium pusillum]